LTYWIYCWNNYYWIT